MRCLRPALLALSLLAACSGNPTPRPTGPNYSSSPCVDNCGNDPTCQASCRDVGNQPVPPPNVPLPGR
jgi:hypothetical protein